MKKEKKKYYSAVKDYSTIKRPHICFQILKFFVKIFFPKNELIWKTTKWESGEPVFLVSNHTKIYAPVYFILNKKEIDARLWTNSFFFFPKECWHHMWENVLKYRHPRHLLGFIALLIIPIICAVFRAINGIPVFHKSEKVETITFKKSMETFDEGVPQLVFPEKVKPQVNEYLFEFKTGYTVIAEKYYMQTGKKVKFYPVYCAQSLRKIVIGEPIEYNPNIQMDEQRYIIKEYLQNKIKELADGLGPHKPVLYG